MYRIMKNIDEYIDDKIITEGLISWFKAFFRKIYNMQRARIKNNKVEMYDVDEKQMKVQKEPVKLNDVDKNTISIWNDKQVGFPISAMIATNPKKYKSSDKQEEFNPDVYCYFSKDGFKTYAVGVLMIDEDVSFIQDYKHIVNLESCLIVDNPSEVNESMLDQYSEYIKKQNSNIKGFTAKALHPKLKGNLVNAGFKVSNSDREIFIYNIK